VEVIAMTLSDDAKGRLIVTLFFLGLPMFYLGPVIINAIADLILKSMGQ